MVREILLFIIRLLFRGSERKDSTGLPVPGKEIRFYIRVVRGLVSIGITLSTE
jgi:hypothetical protein